MFRLVPSTQLCLVRPPPPLRNPYLLFCITDLEPENFLQFIPSLCDLWGPAQNDNAGPWSGARRPVSFPVNLCFNP